MYEIKLPRINCEVVCQEIGDFVIDTVIKRESTGCIVGLSGGVDSSTTAALIKSAFDRFNADTDDTLELVGYILPSSINKTEDVKDAQTLAKALDIRYEVHNIEKPVEAFRVTNPEAFEKDYHKGNLISRVRANVLSTKAATERKLLAGTGNKDEDYGIGYYTLFGDGAVHFSPIAGLSKRLVRKMALHLGVAETIVNRIPTAGLEPGQSDFKDLGYDYDIVELVTEGLEQGFTLEQLTNHEQLIPLIQKQIEQYQSIYGTPKLESVEKVVIDVYRRHQQAKGKVEIIHPQTPKITLSYE
ncbi:MAG: NAD(+) synthase [Desulfobacterales bacterium]|jgi:NAD+ synthase